MKSASNTARVLLLIEPDANGHQERQVSQSSEPVAMDFRWQIM
jgi:hypothetical protein